MARTVAELPQGARITDYISLGVIAEKIPLKDIRRVLQETGRESRRQRNLPAHVVVYYVVALALYMQSSYGEVLRCLCEGLQWLGLEARRIRRTGKSGISQARSRLGAEPMRRLYEDLVGPLAQKRTRGAFYRSWRLVSLDGSTLDVADEAVNEQAYGRPGASRGRSAFPKIRFTALVENGTHVLFGAQMDGYQTGELTLAGRTLGWLKAGMLCLADRGFFSFEFWCKACATGADLLWRVQGNAGLPCRKALPDGSYLSRIYPSPADRRNDRNGVCVRVVEYCLRGSRKPDQVYRLITTLLDPDQAPACELAALYHQRWEIETTFDELKTHLRGRQIVLRSKTPELVCQEFFGLMLAHFAVRSLMHEAALQADLDPDQLSFLHSVRVLRRKISGPVSFPPSADPSDPPASSGGDP